MLNKTIFRLILLVSSVTCLVSGKLSYITRSTEAEESLLWFPGWWGGLIRPPLMKQGLSASTTVLYVVSHFHSASKMLKYAKTHKDNCFTESHLKLWLGIFLTTLTSASSDLGFFLSTINATHSENSRCFPKAEMFATFKMSVGGIATFIFNGEINEKVPGREAIGAEFLTLPDGKKERVKRRLL